MTAPHKHTPVESRRPLRLRPLPRPGGEAPTDAPAELEAWIHEWSEPTPGPSTDD